MHDLTPGLIRQHIACLVRAADDETAPAAARDKTERHGTENANGHA